MTFTNRNTEKEYTIASLKKCYESFRREDPENNPETFTIFIHAFIMDTINGRNDFTINGLTMRELFCFVSRLQNGTRK